MAARMVPGRFAIVALVVVAKLATAGRPPIASFSVEVVTHQDARWQADALAAALRVDLVDDQLRLARADEAPATPPELVLRAELVDAELRYVLTHRGGAPIRGVIAVRGMPRLALAGVLRDVMHRAIGPRDAAAEPGPPAVLPAPGPLGGALAALAVLAGLLAAPLGLAGLLRVSARGVVRRIALAIASVGAVAVALVVAGDRLPEGAGAVVLAGGLAWGAFLAVAIPRALPILPGLHRVEHHELGSVLASWLALALQRTLIVAVAIVPLGFTLGWVGSLLELPPLVTFGVIAPIGGLALRLIWRALVEVVSTRLDRELVDGDPSAAQPWHPQVRAYFTGYLRRANVAVDRQVLEQVRFLPGKGDAIAIYGGGTTHTRIVIGRSMLEHALAPYGRPHDYAMPRVSTLHWTHWNAGLVMPTEAGAKLATQDERRPAQTVDDGEHERVALGQLPTLTGIVEPADFDPRKSYRPDEDPLWLDWDPGEEFDGTDAGDKDYLFGALVHAIGMIERHEDRAAAIALAWRRWGRTPRWATKVFGPLRALAARRTAALGDVSTALNGARHHLVQYLAWNLWHREELATPRAYPPELAHTSRTIYAALEAAPEDADPAHEVARHRLAQLRLFATGTPVRRTQRQRLAVAFAVVAAVAAVALLVVQAVLYHPIYEQRMTQARSADGK